MGNLAGFDPLRPCGVILAGGQGRRMLGADKALVTLYGQTFLQHCINRLAPQVGALALSARGDPARFAPYGLPILPDPVAGQMGPLAGICAGVIWAADLGASHIACVPVDGPFLPMDLVARLGIAPVPRLAMAGGRQHPTFGLWPVHLAGALAKFLASGAVPRLRDFADLTGAEWVKFPDAQAFANLNTPDDLDRARAKNDR